MIASTVDELLVNLKEFRQKHGNLKLTLGYYCMDCRDEHIAGSVELLLIDDSLRIEANRLGES